MDFVTGLPRTLSRQDVIWVIVDRLTKITRFVPIKVSYKLEKLDELYVHEIVRFMQYRYPLCRIETLISLPSYGKTYMRQWIIQQTTEKIDIIQTRMKATHSRQKIYVDKRRRQLEFEVGDKVILRIAPMKGVMRFGKNGKLSPKYIGPLEILDQIGLVAYRVALPPAFLGVHNVSHVSMLRKYIHDPTHVIDHKPLQIQENMTYTEEPVWILDRKEQVL
ncbi:hypothetical protein F2P56_008380 [Juglans regia]|uniref:Tf2-1-like SH3-like domain-containing protein n=2 Tax=Juglans regia TaxID=51240 RepID=A0A833XV02_JUGRE|nr:uncharacterized protein LOC109012048 [Juglans regia]KAF5471601.1 hypothetical protein F2P56_008380 [Juglans regia]